MGQHSDTLQQRIKQSKADKQNQETLALIAKVAHEAVRGLEQSKGNNSRAPWLAAPEFQQAEMMQTVAYFIVNPDKPASSCHEGIKTLHDPLSSDEQQAKDQIIKSIVLALV